MRCYQLATGMTGEGVGRVITHRWRLQCNVLDNLQQRIGFWVSCATVPPQGTLDTLWVFGTRSTACTDGDGLEDSSELGKICGLVKPP